MDTAKSAVVAKAKVFVVGLEADSPYSLLTGPNNNPEKPYRLEVVKSITNSTRSSAQDTLNLELR